MKWCDSKRGTTNKRYTGKLARNFERRGIRTYEFTEIHEPIVPEFLYRPVEMNKKMKEKMERFDTRFLLSNLVRCSLCHSPLTTKNSSTKRNRNDSPEYLEGTGMDTIAKTLTSEGIPTPSQVANKVNASNLSMLPTLN